MLTRILTLLVSCIVCLVAAAPLSAQEITLEQTLKRLLDTTTRGRIIAGEHEVARAKFSAEKIGYYLPAISLNSTLPSYGISEDYEQFYGFPDPILFKRKSTSNFGNIRLRQKVVTGGDVSLSTQMEFRDYEYPYLDAFGIKTATSKRRSRLFIFEFNQPLLQRSASRAAYYGARDNLEQADIQWRIDQAELKKEGITAYFDLLIAEVDRKIARCNSDLADFNAHWDSVKFADSVITEETWVESKSERLEKRLALYDADASYEEKANDFYHLLDYPGTQTMTLTVPVAPPLPPADRRQWYLSNAEFSSETQMARTQMEQAERRLGQSRSLTGINGNITATYSVGRGTVTQSKDIETEQDINTTDWRVSLDLSYPIWDGGATGANIRSQELAYESARLAYLAAQRQAASKMAIALKRIEINQAKLQLLDDELALAQRKLGDAETRFENGLISQGALLENHIYYLEAEKNRLTTLKDYFHDLTELEKTETP